MAAFDFGGLLSSDIFGGGESGLEDYLTAAQKQRMNDQAMMAVAASLLKSSGRSAVPIGLGQALGEAYGAGQTGYQQAQQGAISNITTKQKLDEYKRSNEMLSGMQKMLMGTRDLKDKYQLMDLLEIAERKKKWHYRQENFNVSRASTLLQAMLSRAYKSIA